MDTLQFTFNLLYEAIVCATFPYVFSNSSQVFYFNLLYEAIVCATMRFILQNLHMTDNFNLLYEAIVCVTSQKTRGYHRGTMISFFFMKLLFVLHHEANLIKEFSIYFNLLSEANSCATITNPKRRYCPNCRFQSSF